MQQTRLVHIAALIVSCAACAPADRAEGSEGVRRATRSEAWPLMLAHCLRAPDCDPMTDIDDGANEASNHAGEVTWFTRKPTGEAATLTIGLHASRGRGGAAGRTLTIDEHPDSLAGHQSRRSSLMLTFAAMADGAPALKGLSFRSAWVLLANGSGRDFVVEITGGAGRLLREGGTAIPVPYAAGIKGLSPVTIQFARVADREGLRPLLAALRDGETLSLKISDLSGQELLSDVIYASGYGGALEQAAAAATDAEIAVPITARCARFSDEPDAFWTVANVTPALLLCDPRLPQERR